MFVTESHLSAPRLVCPWDPCPSSGCWLNQEDPFSLSTHRCSKMQTVTVLGTLILVVYINVGDAMLSTSGSAPGASLPGTHVCTFRQDACDASHGIRDGFFVLLPPHNAPGNRSRFTSHGWPGIATSLVFKKRMGKMFKYCILNSGCLAHSR